MKKFYFVGFVFFTLVAYTQEEMSQYDLYAASYYAISDGEFVKALGFLKPLVEIPVDSLEVEPSFVYQAIGTVYYTLFDYENSFKYLELAEDYTKPGEASSFTFFLLYNSIARVYTSLFDFYNAFLYLNKALQSLEDNPDYSLTYYKYLAMVYNNLGLYYYRQNDYNQAKIFFSKSLEARLNHNVDIGYSVYMYLGRVADRTGRYEDAEKLYTYAIESILEKYGSENIGLRIPYLEYAELLIMTGRYDMVEEYIRKSLDLALNAYGVHHPGPASCYQIMGDLYLAMGDYEKAEFYYQVALNSLHPGFSSIETEENPPVGGSLDNIQYIEILKRKAFTLYKHSISLEESAAKIRYLELAVQTIQLAIRVKTMVQDSYTSLESRMFISENEKELYTEGYKYASALAGITGNTADIENAWNFASLYKAYELKKRLYTRESMDFMEKEDSLFRKMNSIKQSIRELSNYIILEENRPGFDSGYISELKDELFDRSRSYDTVQNLAQGRSWFEKTNSEPEILGTSDIRQKLRHGQTLVDYVLSPEADDSSRVLYITVISKKDVHSHREVLDTSFNRQLDYYLASIGRNPSRGTGFAGYDSLKQVSYYLYQKLVEPVRDLIRGKELVIIPDEKLFLLPFESLISEYRRDEVINYSNLPYLQTDYRISYSYSANLLFSDPLRSLKRPELLGFAPLVGTLSELNNAELEGARKEVVNASKYFPGKQYYGPDAMKTRFLEDYRSYGICHFAMHSNRNASSLSEGFLEFYPADSLNKLWAYEISYLDIPSMMVVLSGCNTGTGIINRGEGVFSLGRSFFEAGAGSVIQTLWEVSDGSSSAIMQDFYRQLSKGRNKNISLYRAKKNYLEHASPLFSHPYYWSGIQLMGDDDPLVYPGFWVKTGGGIILLLLLVVYFTRRSVLRRSLRASD